MSKQQLLELSEGTAAALAALTVARTLAPAATLADRPDPIVVGPAAPKPL